MDISEIKGMVPALLYEKLSAEIKTLRPAQKKAIDAGLFAGKNLLVCTPTASGKTLIAELALVSNILSGKGKGIYIVPLKALASEKFRDFHSRYNECFRMVLAIGDMDSDDPYLSQNDLIFATSEKLDSLLRHRSGWLSQVRTLIIDEIHLLNDATRGPILEILITMMRKIIPSVQIIGLSATIGNPDELAAWLDANLVIDAWRPVALEEGISVEGKVTFYPSRDTPGPQ